jgi:16S rRNA (guanine1207-N2)-methyltransferase
VSPTLQLLAKAELPSGQWLVINPPADWRQAGMLADATLYSEEWAIARQLDGAQFGLLPETPPQTSDILLFLPKAKPRFQQLLQTLLKDMPAMAVLWVVGENSGGIKSAVKPLAERFADVTKVANAKRCGLIRCRDPLPMGASTENAETPAEPLVFQQWQLATAPGLFNKGEVDQGTQLLLAHLPKLRGRVLDMGCGGGVLSLAALAAGAESVLAVDSSAVALAASQQSFALNGVAGAEVQASDVFSDIPRTVGGTFDFILSNPPFHSGIATDYQPAQQLIEGARRYLKPGGRMILVANRHLAYEQWLDASFKRWEVLEQRNGFKVLVAYQGG